MFHAVILAGGPGSGKTWVSDNLFSQMGFQRVDSDDIFNKLKKTQAINNPVSPNLIDAYKDIKDKERLKSYQVSMNRAKSWQSIGKPYVIDITGRRVQTVVDIRQELIEAGYDVYMVFINTDLDIALQRNQERERNEPENLVKSYWDSAQKAKNIYQKLFGSKFHEINNNTQYSKSQYKDAGRMVNGWVRAAASMFGDPFSVENPIGQQKLSNYWRVDKEALFSR